MIVVFGSINLDLVARTERLPQPGETIAGHLLRRAAGRQGRQSGDRRAPCRRRRRHGRRRRDRPVRRHGAFRAGRSGVDVGWVRRDATPTGVALIHVDASGQNAITVIPGANAHVLAATVPDAALGPGTTVLLQLEVPLEAVREIASRARRCGARVILNAAPARSLPAALLADLDVLLVNAIEAATLATALDLPGAPEDFATAMHRRHGCAAVVTLGPRGVLAVADGTALTAAAPAVRVVDTTGAGDAFAGALAAALDRRAGWPRAIAEGVAAGSLACTVVGAQAALPAAAAIRRLATQVESTLHSEPMD